MTPIRLRMLLSLSAFAYTASACGGDNTLHPCDIREASCQFDVFLAVQDVRGTIWDPWLEPPPMRVISEKQYRAEVIASQMQALDKTGGRDYVTAALKLLHMIDPHEAPSAQTDFTVSNVAAYYSSRTREVTIVDHGGKGNQNAEVQTLAHELTHAAQDRDIGFGRIYQNVHSSDASNATSALLEGEATMYGLLVDAKQIDLPIGRIDWRILSNWSSDMRTSIYDDPSPYRLANTQLIYPLGGSYVAQAYVASGPLGVRRLFDHPPLSARRFMAGHGSEQDVPVSPWTCAALDAPPGLDVVVRDELGALNLYAFATRLFPMERDAWEHALTWTGDRFYVFADTADTSDSAALVVVWLVRCQSADAALALQAAIGQAPWSQEVATAVDGETLHVLAGTKTVDDNYDAWMTCPQTSSSSSSARLEPSCPRSLCGGSPGSATPAEQHASDYDPRDHE